MFITALSRLWGKTQCAFYAVFGRNIMCSCGHKAKRRTVLTINGNSGVFVIGKKREYCPQCFAKASIRCAWCGDTIIPGDAITLYTPLDNDFKIPSHAIVYKNTPALQLVGCMGWECAHSGADFAGFWVMPGKVQLAMSPIGMLMANLSKGDSGPIIVNDVSNPNEAVLVPENTANSAN